MNASVPVDAITVADSNGNSLPLASLPSFESDGQTLDVTLAANPIASGNTSATVSVNVQSLLDSVGNTVATKTSSVVLSKSSTLPVLTAARQVPGSNTQIEVTLNEAVAFSGTAQNDFYVTDSKGNPYAVTSVGTEDSNNNVILTLGSALPVSGTYKVALGVGTATDGSGNTNAATSTSFAYTAPAAAQLTATILSQYDTASTSDVTDSSANRKIVVQFNQMNVVNGIDPTTGGYYAGAADNPANYSLDGAALPTGTKVTYTAGTTGNDYVTIDLSNVSASNLPSEFANGGTGVVTVSNVQDAAGATVQYTSAAITVKDTTAPTITGAYITGNSTSGYTITLTASEKLKNLTEADFVVQDGTAPVTVDTNGATLSSDGQHITLKVSTDKAAITDATKVNVGIASAATTDLAGNAFVNTTTPIAVTNYTN